MFIKNIGLLRTIIFILVLLNLSAVLSVTRTIGIIKNDLTGLDGYTLFAPMDLTTTYLIDNYGRVINIWESQYRPNLGVYLLENGNLARTIMTSDGNYGVEIMTWDGEVVWEFFYTDEMYYQHHDIEPLPNGNILFLVRDIRIADELIDVGRDTASISTARIWLEKIVEITTVLNKFQNIFSHPIVS